MVKIRRRDGVKIGQNGLALFEPGFTFAAADARFDQIKVTLTLGGTIAPDPSAVHRIFKRIGSKGSEGSDVFRSDGIDVMPKLKVRLQNQNWLFSGEVVYRSNRLTANLWINPTRFFNHNGQGRPVNRALGEYYKLAGHIRAGSSAEIESLNRNDNLIQDSRLKEAARLNWEDYTSDYLCLVHDFIIDELKRYDNRDIFIFNEGDVKWRLQQVEVYWEFYHQNAALVAKDFGIYAANYFKRYQKGWHDEEYGINEKHEFLSSSYIFIPSKKIHLAVYAKTSSRIRIECRFKVNPRKIYTDEFTTAVYDNDSVSGFRRILGALRLKAIEELKPLQQTARKYKTTPVPNLSAAAAALSVLGEIIKNDHVYIRNILQGVLTTGQIVETDDEAFNTILKKIEKNGLIRKAARRKDTNQPRTYVLDRSLEELAAWMKAVNKEEIKFPSPKKKSRKPR